MQDQKPHTSTTAIIALVLSSVSMLGMLGSIAYCVYDFTHNTPLTIHQGADGNSANFTEGSIAEIAAKVSPAVVSILIETKTNTFFGQSTATGAGTGMIVTSDGYVLTNKHVVEGARKVQIITEDGKTYDDVKIMGYDPVNDAAFLKINGVDNLPTVALGDSKTISVGQQVIAIGNALGEFQNTVTSGIISGLGRSITATSSDYSSSESLSDMLQTDAAINSGNSGGPLINAAGEVIGINTATSASAEAIGFSIPISSIKGTLDHLIQTGEISRAYIGVYYINLNSVAAEEYDTPVKDGAYVHSDDGTSPIVKKSPADKAGLKDGDIITAINATKIRTGFSLATLIGEYKPGDTVQLTVLRDGKEIAVNITLGNYE